MPELKLSMYANKIPFLDMTEYLRRVQAYRLAGSDSGAPISEFLKLKTSSPQIPGIYLNFKLCVP